MQTIGQVNYDQWSKNAGLTGAAKKAHTSMYSRNIKAMSTSQAGGWIGRKRITNTTGVYQQTNQAGTFYSSWGQSDEINIGCPGITRQDYIDGFGEIRARRIFQEHL